jgi:hypothetical protein
MAISPALPENTPIVQEPFEYDASTDGFGG